MPVVSIPDGRTTYDEVIRWGDVSLSVPQVCGSFHRGTGWVSARLAGLSHNGDARLALLRCYFKSLRVPVSCAAIQSLPSVQSRLRALPSILRDVSPANASAMRTDLGCA